MPITDPYAVTQANATPERVTEILTAYGTALLERSTSTVGANPERARKLESSLQYHERSLTYLMSFLLEPDGETDPITDEVRWEISQLRVRYAGRYEVPPIEEQALALAQQHAKRARADARAARARQAPERSPQPPQAPPAAEPVLDGGNDLDAILAALSGLTVEAYRARATED